MRKNLSYLDSINEGRKPRARASLEDLDRTLRGLEEKIGSKSAGITHGEAHSSRDIADRFRELAHPDANRTELSGDRTAAERLPSSASFKNLAQDIEFARMQEKNVAAVESIAADLKNLRGELQGKMVSGLRREFDSLRSEIAETYQAVQSGANGKELSDDIARLSENIRALAQRSDDGGVNMLRMELDEVKRALSTVAREDSIQQINQRWNDMDDKWTSLHSSQQADRSSEPEFQALVARLEEINDAIERLPNSTSLSSLEDKLRILASAVEQLSNNQEPVATPAFDMIEQRLDEISRAIVASSVSVQAATPNTESFERVEARIASLARQIEELSEVQTSSDLIERVNQLTDRVENLAIGTSGPPDAVESLAAQIAALAEKIETGGHGGGSDTMLQDLEQRYIRLAELIERHNDAAEQQGQAFLRDFDARLDSATTSNGGVTPSRDGDDTAIIQVIDDRFNELARQFDDRVARGADDPMIRNLEARLEEISNRLEQSGPSPVGIEPDLIHSLENQIAGLMHHLDRPESAIPDQNDDIGPRLRDIEKSIASSRDQILAAAREAAEAAIRSMPVGSNDEQSAVGLADDLKSLEQLARKSDERNSRTFEAIHDTLLKIVERLGTLEAGAPAEPRRQAEDQQGHNSPRQFDEHDTPSIEMEQNGEELVATDQVGNERGRSRRAEQRSPAEAAEAAALAAAGDSGSEHPQVADEGARKSMLGGLAKALKGKAQDENMSPADVSQDQHGDDNHLFDAAGVEAEPDGINTPLEPGSGAPDLGSIMAKVNEERNDGAGTRDLDAAKSDFIAAARRAAQAAAAEAETSRIRMDAGRSGKRHRAVQFLQEKRKPILIGASVLLIALAGVQLGKAFLVDNDVAAVAEAPQIEEEALAASDSVPDGATDDIASQPDDQSSVRVVEPADNTTVASADAANEPVAEPAAQMTNEVAPAPQIKEEVKSTPAPTTTVEAVPTEAGPVALREAAQAGDPKALYEVATRYAEGRGVQSDLKTAAKWYRTAADLGFAPAQYRIGNFYEKGLGIERDPAKAMTWYQLAAEQGNASAMHNLAVLFAMGANGQTDNDSAARWFERAAELGVKDSQFNLGILTAKGVGTPQNLEESYKWFALAAKTGDKDAASKRDEIANALRPDQLTTAKAAVDLWKAKPVIAESNTVEIPDQWKEDKATTASVDIEKAVKNIQLILNKTGYDAGPADGVMGAKTKNAIAAFQKDNGMPATGEVDEALVKALLSRNQ